MSVCLCLLVCVCMSPSTSNCVHHPASAWKDLLCLSGRVYICLCVYVCLCVIVCMWLSICVRVFASVFLIFRLSCACPSLRVCVFICPSACLCPCSQRPPTVPLPGGGGLFFAKTESIHYNNSLTHLLFKLNIFIILWCYVGVLGLLENICLTLAKSPPAPLFSSASLVSFSCRKSCR